MILAETFVGVRPSEGLSISSIASEVCEMLSLVKFVVSINFCFFLFLFFTGITRVLPENQRLFKDERIMEDNRCLADYGLISTTARAQCPASLNLTF